MRITQGHARFIGVGSYPNILDADVPIAVNDARAVDKDELDEEQEPELTVIKGVGPFAVALSKGASDLGLFDETPTPPNISAVRQVKPKKASRYFNPFIGVQVRDGAKAVGT